MKFAERKNELMQKAVKEFLENNHLYCGEQIRYIDLSSEVGELGKEIIKSTNYGKQQYSMNESALEEMGDCLFSLLALCCEMNIDADQALQYALEKYQKRLGAKGTIDSGR